mmetsp:Transcript_12203/g.23191  ORF Transcript_12203/g.23191 Transcript_12203/m.23191 type:complete len:243 (-) Transcript_12203:588-1316(-)
MVQSPTARASTRTSMLTPFQNSNGRSSVPLRHCERTSGIGGMLSCLKSTTSACAPSVRANSSSEPTDTISTSPNWSSARISSAYLWASSARWKASTPSRTSRNVIRGGSAPPPSPLPPLTTGVLSSALSSSCMRPCSRRVRRVKSSAVCPPSRHLISANSGRLLGNTFCSATWYEDLARVSSSLRTRSLSPDCAQRRNASAVVGISELASLAANVDASFGPGGVLPLRGVTPLCAGLSARAC